MLPYYIFNFFLLNRAWTLFLSPLCIQHLYFQQNLDKFTVDHYVELN